MVSVSKGWSTTSVRRVVALAGIAVLVATGCNRWSGSASGAEGRSSDTESGDGEASAPDRGEEGATDSPEDQGEWAEQVRDKMTDSPDRARREPDDRSEAVGCRLFPDSCGEGRSCFVASNGSRRCAAFDPDKSVGDACRAEDRCNAGQQCVGGTSPVCLETCDPDGREGFDCPDGRVCTPVLGPDDEPFDWGACRRIEDECRPWPDDSCTIGEACVQTSGGLRCRDYSETATLGAACVRPSDCRLGQICVVGESGLGVCRARCDDEHPCAQKDCRPLTDRAVGFCPAGGRAAQTEPPMITGY